MLGERFCSPECKACDGADCVDSQECAGICHRSVSQEEKRERALRMAASKPVNELTNDDIDALVDDYERAREHDATEDP